MECSETFAAFSCGCKGYTVVRMTCRDMDCPECKRQNAARRRAATLDRLKARPKGLPVVYTVFTVPRKLRDRYKDPEEWGKVRRAVWRFLKTKFGALYGCEASHPFGERPDRDGFHPHLNFLWIPREKRGGFLDIERLKGEWARVLGIPVQIEEQRDLAGGKATRKVRGVVVHSEYTHSPGKIFHWSKYVPRPWPGFSWWCGAVRWYGPKDLIKRRAPEPWTCRECKGPMEYDEEATEICREAGRHFRGDPTFWDSVFDTATVRYRDSRQMETAVPDPGGTEEG